METCVYKNAGGCEIKLDVYPLAAGSPQPCIVWIHGGALIGGGRGSMQPVLRDMLARAGFVQVSIDYRLAPETKIPEIIYDVKDAFRWVREYGANHFAIDPNRIGVIGHSAGGYLTLMTGFCVSPRPQALVAFYGYGDIIAPWYSKPDEFYRQQKLVTREEALAAVGTQPLSETNDGNRFKFYLYCRQNGLWPLEVAGVDPNTDSHWFNPFCPERNVTAEYPPTLLLHGTSDTDVPYQQSVDMAAALKKGGIEHELITIDGGPHGFDGRVKPEMLESQEQSQAVRALIRTVSFFASHLTK
jgi:acetyl esterase/lipase